MTPAVSGPLSGATDEIPFSPWRLRMARLLAGILFRRIRQYGRQHVPASGPVFFACTHRNGAVDGCVVSTVLTRPLFILGANLTDSPLMRIFFGGHLAINRTPRTLAENRENRDKLAAAARMATAGRQVVMFPEGTSWLGPTLRPVRKGMAWLIRQALKELPEIVVIPTGLHYERGDVLRSDVEVHFGPPLRFSPEDAANLDAITTRLADALSGVAVIFTDADAQTQGECLAHAALHLDPGLSHRNICRAFAHAELPAVLMDSVQSLYGNGFRRPPILPATSILRTGLHALLLSLVVLPAGLINLPTCLGAFLLAGRYADDTNVVTLWRMLTGSALWVLQTLIQLAVLFRFCGILAPLILAGMLALSRAGLRAWRPWKTDLLCLRNALSAQRTTLVTLTSEIRQWLHTAHHPRT